MKLTDDELGFLSAWAREEWEPACYQLPSHRLQLDHNVSGGHLLLFIKAWTVGEGKKDQEILSVAANAQPRCPWSPPACPKRADERIDKPDNQASESALAFENALMNMYLIVLGKTKTGYSAHAPDVLGCAAVGKTVDEVRANMKEALQLHFGGMAEDGDPIPLPGGVTSYRQVMKDLDVDRYLLGHVRIDTRQFADNGAR